MKSVKPNALVQLLKETATAWDEDNVARLAASLAYYTLLSIAPLIILAVAVAGLAFGEDAARKHISAELSGVVGAAPQLQLSQSRRMRTRRARAR